MHLICGQRSSSGVFVGSCTYFAVSLVSGVIDHMFDAIGRLIIMSLNHGGPQFSQWFCGCCLEWCSGFSVML